MATIEKFEDLICWQKARLLTREVYKICRDLNISIFKRLNIPVDYGFCDQIQRASVSVMSNIAEGFERGTKQEFLNYLYIAKGSAGEVRAQLYVAIDIGYLNSETFKYLNGISVECSRLISSFISKVKTSEFRGLQHRKEYRKGMSDINKMLLDSHPEWKELYNAEKDEIEFWRKNS
ncbi:MAG: four helix bundle protein [Candidatus Yanofskybacteria bacterium CG10_big_fil_rev_8_21_14_0_10_37_15]|uniref:Four helix bundle protein n=1 Tax=Candidatus Yanofskybacteria bacterium CG10_big_fil_rev_8_21_14_0_10_37_15 TaxID=1975097 RepID=A0A2H0R5G8_9BACT|nr:MAG: four helix bundle protein [Candidatus Yanofskybacteria bacterium CG10_big_fil_rev_8_21_14_0_10_37_15]